MGYDPQAQAKSRRRLSKLGTERIRVPVQPAQEKLQRLHKAGESQSALARKAGITSSAVWKIINAHPGKTVDPETMAAVMSIAEEPPALKRARAHLAALRKHGWTAVDLAEETGLDPTHIRKLASNRHHRGKFKRVRDDTLDRLLSVSLPPPSFEQVDEVVVMRLLDPLLQQPVAYTAAEISLAAERLSARRKITNKQARRYILKERHMLYEQV